MKRAVVIIHPGALGDVLLAVPALRRLRTEFPFHELLLLARPQVSQLLLECRLIDAWSSIEGRTAAALFGDTSVSPPLEDWLHRCDLAIAWLRDPDGGLERTLRSGGAKVARIGSPFTPQSAAIHQSDRFLEIAGLTQRTSASDAPLEAPEEWRQRGRQVLLEHGLDLRRPLIVLHPGSGSPHKCAATDVLGGVVDRIHQRGCTPLFLEGPSDAEAVGRLCAILPIVPAVIRDLDLPTVAGLLTEAQNFVGHDSGITHLAALFGIPTVALFGPTDPGRWGPRGRHVTVVQGEVCRCRSWNEVQRCSDRPCLNRSVDAIIEQASLTWVPVATAGNSSLPALSLPTPYARVAS